MIETAFYLVIQVFENSGTFHPFHKMNNFDENLLKAKRDLVQHWKEWKESDIDA